jgi:epoxyqueuosine reductase QueG
MTTADLGNRLTDFTREWPGKNEASTRWRTPLLGVADTEDPLLETIRGMMDPSYHTPGDFLPGARRIIAFFIPFDEGIPASNRGGEIASPEWAAAYIDTNRLIGEAAAHLAGFLESSGYRTALLPATGLFDPVRLVSTWSHRHAAYAAGLGTFGRNNMLITEAGCAGRLGTLFTDAPLGVTPRPAIEYCLHKRGIPCRVCLDRCTFGALADTGFDRDRCYERCKANAARYEHLGKADVCGKCVTALPCLCRIP